MMPVVVGVYVLLPVFLGVQGCLSISALPELSFKLFEPEEYKFIIVPAGPTTHAGPSPIKGSLSRVD